MLLKEHLPLNKSQLHIIEQHHFQNELVRKIITDTKSANENMEEIIQGFETMVVAISDLIVAMFSERPYRPKYPAEIVQKVVKTLCDNNYPSETKMLTNFIRNFYMD
jgi:hypothetical protein